MVKLLLALCASLTAAFSPTFRAPLPSSDRIQRAPQSPLAVTLSDDAVASAQPVTATRVRLSHILVATEELAKVCDAQLAEGMAFEALAESVSTCDSNARGGDLGWINPGLMVPEVDFVAFIMEPGETRIVQSDFGWHVVRVIEASTVPLDMSPLELKARLQQPEQDGLVVVDLRDEEERGKALLPEVEVLWLPYKEWMSWAPRAIDGEEPLSRDCETIFIDHRGGRGERIAQYLSQNGFTRARFVEGGINAYAEQADPRVPVYLESDGDCLTCHEH